MSRLVNLNEVLFLPCYQVLESSSSAITGSIMEPVLFPDFNKISVPIPVFQDDKVAVLKDLNAVEVVPVPEAFAKPVPDAPPTDIAP
jgi:hypothetical protein